MANYSSGTDIEYGFYAADEIAEATAKAIDCHDLNADAFRLMRALWYDFDLISLEDARRLLGRDHKRTVIAVGLLYHYGLLRGDTTSGHPDYGDGGSTYVLTQAGLEKQQDVIKLWVSLGKVTQYNEYGDMVAAAKRRELN